MRRALAPLLLAALLSGCFLLESAPADEGCSTANPCPEGKECFGGRCVLPEAPHDLPVGSTCANTAECASLLLCAEGVCCAPDCPARSCGDHACGIGDRCAETCAFQPLLPAGATCGADGWPSTRDSSPFAALTDGSLLLFSGEARATASGRAGEQSFELHRLTFEEPGATPHWTELPLGAEGIDAPPRRYGHLFAGLPDALCPSIIEGATAPCALLLGGRDDSLAFDDEWLWSGGTFTRVPPSNGARPSARIQAAYAVDDGLRDGVLRPELQRLLLFGGYDCPDAACDTRTALGDTWVLDASGWRELPATASAPPARGRASLAGPLQDGRFVLMGGSAGRDGAPCLETLAQPYELAGEDWQPSQTVPPFAPPPTAFVLHYLRERRLLVLVSGFGAGARDDSLGEVPDRAAWLDLDLASPTWQTIALPAIQEPIGFRAEAFVPGVGLVLYGGYRGASDGVAGSASCRLDLLEVP